MKSKFFTVLGWVILVITALFFVMAGSQKLMGSEEMVTLFQDLGYFQWFMIAVGLLEVVGAILLLIPRTTQYAAIALGILMIGAIISELQLGNTFKAIMPGQWLIVFILIVYIKRRKKASEASLQ